jgi:hypothetical protein
MTLAVATKEECLPVLFLMRYAGIQVSLKSGPRLKHVGDGGWKALCKNRWKQFSIAQNALFA